MTANGMNLNINFNPNYFANQVEFEENRVDGNVTPIQEGPAPQPNLIQEELYAAAHINCDDNDIDKDVDFQFLKA